MKRIVIAGGGTSGWLAAAALGKLFKKTHQVTLIESDEIGRIGVGEATIPPLRTFHRLAGINELALMKSIQGTYKLGIEFSNWAREGDKYFHSFGVTGKECWACDFQHFWVKGRRLGIAENFGHYSPELMAATSQKMWAYQEHGLNFAYHLDAGLYASFLREHSLKHGVMRVEGIFKHVNLAADGSIQSLVMESGEQIAGDLFLDCTGFSAKLISGALNVSYESYGHYLPCDSAVAVQTKNISPPKPYTQAIAHEFGWQWRIPLQHRAGNGLVYSSRHVSDEQAKRRLLDNLEGEPLSEVRSFKYQTGRRVKAWHKNCVAVGLAAGFLEPVESTSIHLAMSAVLRLMKLLPNGDIDPQLVDEFNRKFDFEMESVRDFIILHYCATEREDSSFWRYCKNMEVPESLARRIDIFKRNGTLALHPKELFQTDSWTQVLIGQRIIPESYHPIVDQMSEAELANFLQGLQGVVAQKVSQMPSHQQFIDRWCPATNTNEQGGM